MNVKKNENPVEISVFDSNHLGSKIGSIVVNTNSNVIHVLKTCSWESYETCSNKYLKLITIQLLSD